MMTNAREFADPWPAPEAMWADPPWLMSGISVTAWFETSPAAVSALLSPDFEPQCGTGGVPTRVRFYRVDFEPRDGDEEYRRQMAGQFLEAVIAFKGRIAGVTGEFSAYMWTDSDTYLCWGRENFGWPLTRARFELTGGIWGDAGSAASSCRVTRRDFSWTLEVDASQADEVAAGPSPNWLTPRRILFPGGSEPERRDLLVVRPEVRRAGRFTHRTGTLTLDAVGDSWVATLAPLGPVEVHVLEDFQICVGHDVRIVPGSAPSPHQKSL
jgi:hypothetical protein